MAINFPSSPTDGQKFTSGNMVYTYSSSKGVWTGAPLDTALPFNYIINPTFQISQQNGGTLGNTPNYYIADQWSLQCNASTGGILSLNSTTSGFPRTARFLASDYIAPAAGAYQMLDTRIEGDRFAPFQWGTASAKQAVLRFSYFGNGNSGAKYAVAIRNAAGTRSYIAPFTVAPVGATTTATIVIPGETTGVWAGGTGMGVSIDIVVHCGTTFYAPATNSWQNGNYLAWSGVDNIINTASSNTLNLGDFGLYLDPNLTGKAPPFEFPYNIRQTYSECQRYWQKQLGSIGVGIASTATSQRSAYPNQAFMRIAPTGTLVGTPRAWEPAAYPNVTAIANNYANQYVFEHNFTSAAANTAGRAVALIDMTPSLYIAQNARLI